MLWRQLWPLGLRYIFRNYLINGAILGKTFLNIKCMFWFSPQIFSETFPFQEEFSEISSKISKRLHVKYPLFLSDSNETWIFSTDFRKKFEYNFNQNPSSGSRVVACGQTDMTKLKVAFRNFAKAPKMAKGARFGSLRWYWIPPSRLSVLYAFLSEQNDTLAGPV